jgi:hypothetical protein
MPTVATPRSLSRQGSDVFDDFSDDDRSLEGESVYDDVDVDEVKSHKLLENTDSLVAYRSDQFCGRDAGKYHRGRGDPESHVHIRLGVKNCTRSTDNCGVPDLYIAMPGPHRRSGLVSIRRTRGRSCVGGPERRRDCQALFPPMGDQIFGSSQVNTCGPKTLASACSGDSI